MKRTIIYSVILLLGSVLAGCVRLGIPQQPGFEVAESARSVIVHSQSTFFSFPGVDLTRGADGTLTVRRLTATAEKWTHQGLRPDNTVPARIQDALLPFLVPSCEVLPPTLSR